MQFWLTRALAFLLLLVCAATAAADPSATTGSQVRAGAAKPASATPALPGDLVLATYTFNGQVCPITTGDLTYERMAMYRPADRLKTGKERQQYLDDLLDSALLKDSLWRQSDEGSKLPAEDQAILAEKERAMLAATLRQTIADLTPDPNPADVNQYYIKHPAEFRAADGTTQTLAAVGAQIRQKLLTDARQQYYDFFFEDYLRRSHPLVKEELVNTATPDPQAALLRIGDSAWTYGDLQARLAADPKRLAQFRDPAGRGAVLAEIIRQETAVLAARRLGLAERPAFRQAYARVARDLLFERKVRELYGAITVTEEELAACYNEQKDRFHTEPETRIQMMNLPAAGGETATPAARATAAEQARAAAAEANRPDTDFGVVARRVSPPGWKVDLDFAPQGPRGHLIDLAVEPLRPGQISAPVEYPGGYYVIKLLETRPSRPQTYAEAHEPVEKYLKGQRLIEQKKALLAGLRESLKPHWDEANRARLRAAWFGE